jgi:hypothetical protein
MQITEAGNEDASMEDGEVVALFHPSTFILWPSGLGAELLD